MIVDGFGIVHPTENDPITTEGLLHIAECSKCAGTFDEQAVEYAKTMNELWQRAVASLRKEGQEDGS